MSLRNQIPAFYWYYCTVVDPLLSLSAVYMVYFDPSWFMDPGFARSSPFGKLTPSHLFLMHQFGGPFLAWAFLQRTMLLETTDMNVWTRFQTALAFTDVAVIYSQIRALEAQGRLGWGMLRWEESSNAVILVTILLIRVGFVVGLGFGKGGATKKRV
ncbi:hypothetical protein CC86DRAFT_160973 [Ophiobolus disseminans]|uniref:DUF7704 domain-containing protein n=1 Tax=Ophiobolus disseminans TaxID=1469910 RepID=A0A6A7AAV1_9PLEO|nr:hypothetical protein CC86DRAFT_160973 [Ophiobolus disseminans]